MRATRVLIAAILVIGVRLGPVRSGEPPKKTSETVRLDGFGDPLPEGAYARFGTMRFQHRALAVAFVDDKTIVSAGSTIRHWDAATGHLLHEIRDDRLGDPNSAIFCDKGTCLITRGGSSGIQVWRINKGRLVQEYKHAIEDQELVSGSRFLSASSDGSRVAENGVAAAPDNQSQFVSGLVHQIKSKSCFRLATGPDDVRDCAISPDGTRAVTAQFKPVKNIEDGKGVLVIWDAATGKQLVSQDSKIGTLSEVRFVPDGRAIVVVGEKYVTLCSIDGNELWRRPTEGEDHRIACMSDNRLVLLTNKKDNGDLQARVVDLATGLMVGRWHVAGTAVTSAAISPDGQRIVLACADRLHLLTLPSGKEISPTRGHSSGIYTTDLTADGRYLVSADGFDKDAILWEVATGKMVRRFQGHEKSCQAAAISLDGKIVSTCSADQTVRIWELATGRQLFKVGELEQQIGWSLLLPRGQKVAIVMSGGQIAIYDYAHAKQISELTLDLPTSPPMVYYPTDGRLLAVFPSGAPDDAGTASKAAWFDLWDVEAKRIIRHFEGSRDWSFRCALSADFRTLITYGTDGMVQLWEVASGKLRQTIRVRVETDEQQTLEQPVDISYDGTTIASADGGRLDLWDLPTGARIASLKGHDQPITTIDFTPDGRRLLTGSEDTTVLGWDIARPELRARRSEKSLSNEDMVRLWELLRSGDAPAAYRAKWEMAGDPQKTVAFLSERLRPEAPISSKQIRSWIIDLDSPRFELRERAQKNLLIYYCQTESELRQTLATKISAETRNRINRVVEESYAALPTPIQLRELRAIEILEQIATPQARELLRRLATTEAPTRLARDASESLKRLQSEAR